MMISERLNKKSLLIWATLTPLAICLVYTSFYLAGSLNFLEHYILSGTLGIAVWGVAIFIILARLGYDLELNMVKGYYRSYIGVGLLVTICGMAVGAVAVILGFVGTIAIIPISSFLLSLCVVFSSDFFGMNRLPFFLRLLIGGIIIGVAVGLAGFLA
jgi:hypothetical protein